MTRDVSAFWSSGLAAMLPEQMIDSRMRVYFNQLLDYTRELWLDIRETCERGAACYAADMWSFQLVVPGRLRCSLSPRPACR